MLTKEAEFKELTALLPEVVALRDVPQRADFHAEGDALTHTRLSLAALPDTADERVVWATLLHDIGKASTTSYQGGTWRSPGHAEVGAEMVLAALSRLGRAELAPEVAWLVRHHQFFLSWQNLERGLTRRQLRFCNLPLFPLLIQVCQADAAASHGSAKGLTLERVLAQCAAERQETH